MTTLYRELIKQRELASASKRARNERVEVDANLAKRLRLMCAYDLFLLFCLFVCLLSLVIALSNLVRRSLKEDRKFNEVLRVRNR